MTVAGGTDTFTHAIKLADQLLDLRRPDTTRLLGVVSDGYLTDRDAAQKLLTTLHHTGCAHPVARTRRPQRTPFTDTTTLTVNDPADRDHGHRRRRLRSIGRRSITHASWSAAARMLTALPNPTGNQLRMCLPTWPRTRSPHTVLR